MEQPTHAGSGKLLAAELARWERSHGDNIRMQYNLPRPSLCMNEAKGATTRGGVGGMGESYTRSALEEEKGKGETGAW